MAEYHLASAVSEAGGLGLIGAGGAPADFVREQIRKTRELTDKPFGVNIMLMNPEADGIAQVVCEEGVPGSDYRCRKSCKIYETVERCRDCRHSGGGKHRYGKADGKELGRMQLWQKEWKVGGHIGQLTTMTLVPQVVDAVSIPVIAAGGIGDGRGLAAARMLGAEGVQIGTRFLLAKETRIHENYKKKVLQAKDIDTVVTGLSTGHPVRSLRNSMTREYLRLEQEGADFETLERLGLGALRRAVVEGDVTGGTVMAGQIAGMLKEELSCREILEEIVTQAEELMRGHE